MTKAHGPEISRSEAEKLIASVPVWHHRYEIVPGVITLGNYEPGFLWYKMKFPDDLTGRRVLDIGPSDGFFSLNLRKRGAEVVAVPNLRCLRDMLHDAAFDIERDEVWRDRYFASCRINADYARGYKVHIAYGIVGH